MENQKLEMKRGLRPSPGHPSKRAAKKRHLWPANDSPLPPSCQSCPELSCRSEGRRETPPPFSTQIRGSHIKGPGGPLWGQQPHLLPEGAASCCMKQEVKRCGQEDWGAALASLLPRFRLVWKQRLVPASAKVDSSPKGHRVQGEAGPDLCLSCFSPFLLGQPSPDPGRALLISKVPSSTGPLWLKPLLLPQQSCLRASRGSGTAKLDVGPVEGTFLKDNALRACGTGAQPSQHQGTLRLHPTPLP